MKDLQRAVERIREALSLVKAVQHIEDPDRDNIEALLEDAVEHLSDSEPTPARSSHYCGHCGTALGEDGAGNLYVCTLPTGDKELLAARGESVFLA